MCSFVFALSSTSLGLYGSDLVGFSGTDYLGEFTYKGVATASGIALTLRNGFK